MPNLACIHSQTCRILAKCRQVSHQRLNKNKLHTYLSQKSLELEKVSSRAEIAYGFLSWKEVG